MHPVDTSHGGEFVVGELFDVNFPTAITNLKTSKSEILVSAGNTTMVLLAHLNQIRLFFQHIQSQLICLTNFYQPKEFQAVSHAVSIS